MEVKFHDIGEGMTEAEVIQVMVKEGDVVKADQALLEVQTDKMTAEIPSPAAGTVQSISIKAGDLVQVGETLMVIESSSGKIKPLPLMTHPVQGKVARIDGCEREQSTRVWIPKAPSNTYTEELEPQGPKRVLAAPHTRKLARDHGIDLERINGTGRLGRITDQDIFRVLEFERNLESKDESLFSKNNLVNPHRLIKTIEQPSILESEEGSSIQLPFKGRRKAIAKKMVHSLYTIPHVTHFDEADVSDLIYYRDRLKKFDPNRTKGYQVSMAAFFIKAVALALKEFPIFNAKLDEENEVIQLEPTVNMGIATDTDQGLIVPVIKAAESKSILDLHHEMKEFIFRAKENRIKPSEMMGSTFTISNVGPLGSLGATPIINYPEVGLLAFHKTKKKPVVDEQDQIVVRSMMNLSMSFDHRVADGAEAVAFTNKVIQYIEHPELLLLYLK